MGGRGAGSGSGLSKISVSLNDNGSRFEETRKFTQEEVDALNKELPKNSSNKDVRDLFAKKYSDSDHEYGMTYKNGKFLSVSEGGSGSVYISSRRGEGTMHNHPVSSGITGLGLSYDDVRVGSLVGEKMTSIVTKYNGKTVKQSIKFGRNFNDTKSQMLADAFKNKALIRQYRVEKGMSLAKAQETLFKQQDKWLSNVNNQKKYSFSYYSTLK